MVQQGEIFVFFTYIFNDVKFIVNQKGYHTSALAFSTAKNVELLGLYPIPQAVPRIISHQWQRNLIETVYIYGLSNSVLSSTK